MGEEKHIDSWDTLRFIFILGIIIYHTGNYFNFYGSTYLGLAYSLGGYFGNYFFFILSGILIPMTHKEKIKTGKESLGSYLICRLKKVYPVYIFGELLAIVYLITVSGWTVLSIRHLGADALLITSGWFFDNTPYDMPAWFLCVLLLCYIVYFLLAHICRYSKGLYITLICFMILLGAVLIQRDISIPFLYRINGEGYMNFFLGCLLYEGYKYIDKIDKKIDIAIASGTLLLLFIVTWQNESFLTDYKICISIACILIIFLAERADIIRRVLEVKPFVVLGGISMELFLLHLPLLNIYQGIRDYLHLENINTGIQYLVYYLILLSICFGVKHIENAIKLRAERY